MITLTGGRRRRRRDEDCQTRAAHHVTCSKTLRASNPLTVPYHRVGHGSDPSTGRVGGAQLCESLWMIQNVTLNVIVKFTYWTASSAHIVKDNTGVHCAYNLNQNVINSKLSMLLPHSMYKLNTHE